MGGGGGSKVFWAVLSQELEVLAIMNCRGHKSWGEAQKVLPCLHGGGGGEDPRFSHFVAHPLPLLNDPSL